MKTVKILLLVTGLMMIFSLLAGCEGNTKGETALQRCGIGPQTKESSNEDREKSELNEEDSTAALPDIRSFTAQTLTGGTFTEKDLAGRDLTMINVWQTFCDPCIVEMPDLAKLADSVPDRVQIVTWCLDAPGQEDLAKAIQEDAGFTKPTIVSGDGDLSELGRALMYTPTTVLVDSQGKMIGEPLIGAQKDPVKDYTDYINQALKVIGKDAI